LGKRRTKICIKITDITLARDGILRVVFFEQKLRFCCRQRKEEARRDVLFVFSSSFSSHSPPEDDAETVVEAECTITNPYGDCEDEEGEDKDDD